MADDIDRRDIHLNYLSVRRSHTPVYFSEGKGGGNLRALILQLLRPAVGGTSIDQPPNDCGHRR